jgi:hypothetical protein
MIEVTLGILAIGIVLVLGRVLIAYVSQCRRLQEDHEACEYAKDNYYECTIELGQEMRRLVMVLQFYARGRNDGGQAARDALGQKGDRNDC